MMGIKMKEKPEKRVKMMKEWLSEVLGIAVLGWVFGRSIVL